MHVKGCTYPCEIASCELSLDFRPPQDLVEFIWDTRYRLRGPDDYEHSIEDSFTRVAGTLASVEGDAAGEWKSRFRDILADFRFLPGGRILAGAGSPHTVTLFNCFVMGAIEDDLASIFERLGESALTLQSGGGIGCDFSTLRPAGVAARSTGNVASGPVSYMQIWDTMCRTIKASGTRRGAMIGTLRCDHPDIEAFLDAKLAPGELTQFNLSVLVTDEFIKAVAADSDWPLVFPASSISGSDGMPRIERRWPGYPDPVPCAVLGHRRARELWRQLARCCHRSAEPGILFVDRINEMNNLRYCENISCTNPCGEVPLPGYGACNLGSLNLPRFVRGAFTGQAAFDDDGLVATVEVATRMLDNAIDCSRFPLQRQAHVVKASRRIGIGVTGLADALIMLGLDYGSAAARREAGRMMQLVCEAAYRASTEIAREKGAFPQFDPVGYLSSPFIRSLPSDIRNRIGRYGIRNSHLLAIAPTGTISLLSGNVSSGIEPVFDLEVKRRILSPDGEPRSFLLADYAFALWRQMHPQDPLPATFTCARDLAPDAHLRMQARIQRHVDNAVSKTINLPADCTVDEIERLFWQACRLGLKGCTVYRAGSREGVLESAPGCRLTHS